MKGLKQFGAIALAAAMTITFIAPISARAEGIGRDTYQENYDIDKSVEYETDADGELSLKKTKSTTYKNRITGKTYTENEDGTTSGNEEEAKYYDNGILTQMTVGTGNFGYYSIRLDPGATATAVKISKGKKNITMVQDSSSESDVSPNWDPTEKKYYFTKVNGEKEYIDLATTATEEQFRAAMRKQYSYGYRIYGKKAGKAQLKFTVTDQTGKKKTYKVKVTVSDDARTITSLKYGGKSLIMDMNKGANNSNYYAAQSSNKSGNYYVTKKSGKLSFKMGKNYKFIAAYVIKPNAYTTKTTKNWDYSSGTDIDKSETTEAVRKYSRGIDLNGDGDYEDTINGISERSYTNSSFTKVKNNKKIKLNTVPYKEDSKTVYTHGENGKYQDVTTSKDSSPFAETHVIIVYQNKVTKDFGAYEFDLDLKVAKK